MSMVLVHNGIEYDLIGQVLKFGNSVVWYGLRHNYRPHQPMWFIVKKVGEQLLYVTSEYASGISSRFVAAKDGRFPFNPIVRGVVSADNQCGRGES
ncbi:hypothetical protein FACS189421_09280 [Bacteroidia bacterium]|nr:hypothetical protein FACS189421_09280 [Bacteroidia bacterium]